MGSCQVLKNPRKTQNGQTPPTPYPIFFFFGNMYNNKKQLKNTHKKTNNFQKKRVSELGLDPPTHEFFSDFWIFLT